MSCQFKGSECIFPFNFRNDMLLVITVFIYLFLLTLSLCVRVCLFVSCLCLLACNLESKILNLGLLTTQCNSSKPYSQFIRFIFIDPLPD